MNKEEKPGFKAVSKFLRIASTVINMIAMWTVIVISSIFLLDWFLRFLKIGIPGLYDVSGWLMSLVTFFAIPYCWLLGGHIRIDVLRNKLSDRNRLYLDLCNVTIGLIVFGLFTWGGVITLIQDFTSGVVSYDIVAIRTPLWPSRLFLPIGTLLFCLILLTELIYRKSISLDNKDN